LTRYIDKGWRIIPVPHGEKAPRIREWQKLHITPENLSDYFKDDQNVGVLLGEPSRWLTDIDLDCPEALEIAEYFLPETDAIFGRPSKPRSHWLYYCPNAKTTRFEWCSKTIAEIRSTGAQTIFPPSIHPSGEQTQWDEKGEPATVDFAGLKKAVGRLAACVLLAGHYPKKSSRQFAAMALSGWLLRNGWSDEEVRTFLEALCKLVGDEETRTRLAQLGYTVAKVENNQPVTGYPTLKQYYPEPVLQKVATWLGLHVVGRDDDLPEPIPQETLFSDQCPESIWSNILFRGALHLLSSDPGVGKTTFAYALAVALAEGREFLNEQLPKLKVGYFDLETSQNLRGVKLRALGYGGGKNLLFFDISCPVKNLKALVKQYGFELLIIDTVSLFFALKKEEDNAEVNTAVVQPLKALTKETGAAVLLIHHNSKGAKERSKVYRSRGASALPAGCDVVLNLENTEDPDVLRLEVAKNRISGYTPKVYLQKDEGSFTVTERPDSEYSKTQKTEQAILNLLQTRETASLQELSNTIAFSSKKTVQRALQNLLTTGRVVKVERGVYALPRNEQGKNMCNNGDHSVHKWHKNASEAEKQMDIEMDKKMDTHVSEVTSGGWTEYPPHLEENRVLSLNLLSTMPMEERTRPFVVHFDVHCSNPHEKPIPATNGQHGHPTPCGHANPTGIARKPSQASRVKSSFRRSSISALVTGISRSFRKICLRTLR
jgi:RecA-family ATPase